VAIASVVTLLITIAFFGPADYGQRTNISRYQSTTKLNSSGQAMTSTTIKSTRPRAILHIGPHKVASTYIQTKLCEEKDLLESIGFTVPIAKSCKVCSAKHFAGAAFELQKNMDRARLFSCSPSPVTDLKDSLGSYNGSIILSSEVFDIVGDEGVAQLADILSDYETTVVILYRRKLEHIMSYYTQLNKHLIPRSFKEFLWEISSINPSAGPDTSVGGFGGLCYKRLIELYSRHFGKENLTIINYNGIQSAGADPWGVLVKEVIGNKDYQPLEEDERKNVSPDPFLLSVASHYYYSTWLNSTISNLSTVSNVLPKLSCILPLLKPLEEILPKMCTNLSILCSLWEAQELEYIASLNGTSQLLHFDTDSKGDFTLQDTNQTICDIDIAKLETDVDKMQYHSALERVHSQIGVKCSRRKL
jgi:hypothetical protein